MIETLDLGATYDQQLNHIQVDIELYNWINVRVVAIGVFVMVDVQTKVSTGTGGIRLDGVQCYIICMRG